MERKKREWVGWAILIVAVVIAYFATEAYMDAYRSVWETY